MVEDTKEKQTTELIVTVMIIMIIHLHASILWLYGLHFAPR